MNNFCWAKLYAGSYAKSTSVGLSSFASTYTTELGGRDNLPPDYQLTDMKNASICITLHVCIYVA